MVHSYLSIRGVPCFWEAWKSYREINSYEHDVRKEKERKKKKKNIRSNISKKKCVDFTLQEEIDAKREI